MKVSTSQSTFQTQPERVKGHSFLLIALIIFNVLAFIGTVFINAASSISSIGIFKRQTGQISDNNNVNITPAGWTFSTWGIIYTWQGLWLLYNVVMIFRRSENGRLYRTPKTLDPIFHLFYLANLGFNIAWLFMWDAEKFGGAFGLLLALTLSLYVCVFLAHRNIFYAIPHLIRGNKIDLWLLRIFVNNGLAFYATWVTLATNLNLAIAVTYEWKALDKEDSSILALSIVAVVLLTYFALDVYFLEKYTRYTFSPYLQLAIAFAGILTKNWNPNRGSSIYALVLTALGPGIMFITKIVISIYKHQTNLR